MQTDCSTRIPWAGRIAVAGLDVGLAVLVAVATTPPVAVAGEAPAVVEPAFLVAEAAILVVASCIQPASPLAEPAVGMG